MRMYVKDVDLVMVGFELRFEYNKFHNHKF
jgi:hypothetical protein